MKYEPETDDWKKIKISKQSGEPSALKGEEIQTHRVDPGNPIDKQENGGTVRLFLFL